MGEEISNIHCSEGFTRDGGHDHGGDKLIGLGYPPPSSSPAIVTWLPRYGTTPIDWYGDQFRQARRSAHRQKVVANARH